MKPLSLLLAMVLTVSAQADLSPMPPPQVEPIPAPEKNVLVMQGTNVFWSTTALVGPSIEILERMELRGRTNFFYWRTLRTNIAPVFAVVHLTNNSPPPPTGLRVAWQVSGTILTSTSLFGGWQASNAVFQLTSEIFGASKQSQFFRLPTFAPGLPPATGIRLTWDYAGNPPVEFAVYYGASSRSYTNRTVFSATNSYVEISGLPANQLKWFAVTAIDSMGMESDYSAEITYAAPGPGPVRVPVVVTPR